MDPKKRGQSLFFALIIALIVALISPGDYRARRPAFAQLALLVRFIAF
jgi:hypothetical protein